jgi:tetratricopeptide (TPR) repeat protein
VAISALVLLAAAGCTKQSRVDRHLARAADDVAANHFDRAELELKAALQLLPDNSRAQAQLGTLYFNQGRLLPARELLELSLKNAPEALEARLLFGQISLNLAKTAEARESALKVLEKQPASEPALLLLAESSTNSRDLEDARRTIERLRAAAGDGAGFHAAFGVLHLLQGDAASAATEVDRALALDPKSSGAHAYRGVIYLAQRDVAGAKAELKAASDLSPIRSPRRVNYITFLLQNSGREEAKAQLAAILAQAPDFLPAVSLHMKVSFDERRFEDARVAAAKVLAAEPYNYDALLQNVLLRFAQNDAAGAADALTQMERYYPQAPAVKFYFARASLIKGEPAAAEDYLNAAIRLSPNYADAILLLAELNINKGRADAAVSALVPLLRRQPRLPNAYPVLARAYRADGDFASGLKALEAYAAVVPRSPEPPHLSGMLLLESKKPAEARLAFERAVELSPDYWPSLEQLVRLDLAEDKVNAARARATALTETFARRGEAWLISAKIRLHSRDFAGAQSDLAKSIECDPQSQTAYLLLAKTFLASDKNQQAADTLGALAARTKTVGAYMQLAVLQTARGEYAAAAEAYDRALEVDPKFAPALNNLAVILAEHLNQLDKADALANRAREAAPASPEVADTTGWILFRRGEYAKALPFLRASAEKLPDELEVQYHLGMAHYRLGQEQPAQRAFQLVAAAGGAAKFKQEAQDRLAILAIDAAADVATRGDLEKRLAADAGDIVVLSRLAVIEEAAGQAKNAAAHYEAALKVNPESARTMAALVRLYAGELKNPGRAMELSKKAYAIAPNDGQVTSTMGRAALALGDFPWALTLLQAAVRTLPRQAELNLQLAEAYYGTGRIVETEQALNDAVAAEPAAGTAARIARMRGFISAAKDPASATAALAEARQVLGTDPADVPALMVAARAAEQQRDFEGARSIYEKILARNAAFAPAMLRLAVLYAEQLGDDKKAEELAVAARRVFADDPDLTFVLGTISYRRAAYEDAVRFLGQSARKRDRHAATAFYLGMANFRLKKPAESRAQLTRALALGLPAVEAAECRRVLEELERM